MLRVAHDMGQQAALDTVGLDPVQWFISQLNAPCAGSVDDGAAEKPVRWGPPASIEAGNHSTNGMELGIPNYGGV